ncbi:MAG TPA: Rieske 2Fe-2S domain-containing protein [Candidatus Binatia bacterium]|nr:Rieske 2Fe-2S domain-containing protein [Candidatus Binatia bacterium]
MGEQRIIVCRADALGEKETAKFTFNTPSAPREGFVIRYQGKLFAYRNECRHIPMTMDWVENRFLSRDRCYIQCATHGALYRIDSGLCIGGPPSGEFLRALNVEIEDGDIVVTIAE